MTKTFSHCLKFQALFLAIVLLLVGCTEKKEFVPETLSFHGKEGSKEIIAVTFETDKKIYRGGELRKQTIANVDFELKNEVVLHKAKGLFVSNQTVIKKDGLYRLTRIGFPEVGEEFDIEYDNRGYILDVTGYPEDSIYYIPSLVFPETPVKPGDIWGESFVWRDYSVPLPVKTDLQFKFLRVEKFKGNRVYRIQISGSSAFKGGGEKISLQNHVEGYLLWDPKLSVVRYGETRMVDEFNRPGTEYRSRTESRFITRLKTIS